MYNKKCPCCDKEMVYKNKRSYQISVKKNTCCLSCLKTGEKNSFFGKKHSKKTIEKIKNTSKNSEKRKKYYDHIRSEEYRKLLSDKYKGENNPNFGKGYVKSWIKKYGKEKADEMVAEFKKLQSLHSSGENNPMYGKPSPKKSGNGWSGWYKNIFFRSLLELSYIVNVLEKLKVEWCSGEKKDYIIKYENENKTYNYFPDFVINNKYIVECKPKKLWNTKVNKIKFEYAKKFCEENGFKFKLREPKKINYEELNSLLNSGLVVLSKKEKFIKKYENQLP